MIPKNADHVQIVIKVSVKVIYFTINKFDKSTIMLFFPLGYGMINATAHEAETLCDKRKGKTSFFSLSLLLMGMGFCCCRLGKFC